MAYAMVPKKRGNYMAGIHVPSAINRTDLDAPLQRALRSERIEIIDWDLGPLHHSNNPTTDGLYRVTGHASRGDAVVPWSMVLKVIHAADGRSAPTSLGYWKREPLVYQSGILDRLPPGAAVPECFAVAAPSPESIWLWLEDIAAAHDGTWLLSRYGLAARHLGRLNGMYLRDVPCPSFTWLRRDYLRSWAALGGPGISQLTTALSHPLVARIYPDPIAERLIRAWDKRESLLETLSTMPQTFCHMDAMRRNMIGQRDSQGQEQTVFLDWGEAGIGAPGEDLASFTTGSVFLDAETPRVGALQDMALMCYIDGLCDVGWSGDAQPIRHAYAIAASLRVIGGTTWILQTLLGDGQHGGLEQAFGQQIDEIVDRWAEALRVFVDGLFER
jgi:hypothetical protein